MVQVLDLVEDERTFSSLSFLKGKTTNRLDNSFIFGGRYACTRGI